MKTGFANMIFGVLIACVGVLVTGLTYSMASGRGGGTYFVAYGAFVVGAWRFLLGLFQVLKGAIGGSEPETVVRPPSPPASPSAPAARAATTPPSLAPGPAPGGSSAVQTIGAILIADAVLRAIFLGLFASRVPSYVLFHNVSVLLLSLVAPAVLAIGGLAVGVALLRRASAAPAVGMALCVVGLLFHAFGLVGLAMLSVRHVPSLTWVLISVHIAVYVAGLVVLLRASNGPRAGAGFGGSERVPSV